MGDGRTFEELLADYLVIKAELATFRSVAGGHQVGEAPSLALASRLFAWMRAQLLELALLADCGERRGKLAVELADMDREIRPYWEPVSRQQMPGFAAASSEIGRTR
jgi:hypothetical protein